MMPGEYVRGAVFGLFAFLAAVPANAQQPCADNGADHDRETFKNRPAPKSRSC